MSQIHDHRLVKQAADKQSEKWKVSKEIGRVYLREKNYPLCLLYHSLRKTDLE